MHRPNFAPTRRSLLRLGSLLCGSAAASGVARAAAGRQAQDAGAAPPSLPAQRPPPLEQRRRPIQYALKWGMVGSGGSVLERFQLLAELGYDGVELDSPSDLDIDEVLAAKATTGLATAGLVGSQHWSKPLSHPDPDIRKQGGEALAQGLRDAARLSASSLLVVPAVVDANTSYQEAYLRSSAELRQLLPLAAELKVQLLIENVWNNFLLSPLEAAAYVDQFESEWIGWHFDVGNVVNTGWPEHWIEVLGTRIKKLDVKEYSRQKRDDQGLWKGFEVEIGDGDCRWPVVGQALDRLKYQGWAAAEVGGGGRERLADVLARMHRVLQS